jgi:hypothetical protein
MAGVTKGTQTESVPRERTAMRVTTVRFGAELWALLEQVAARDGTSVSQYIREAALARAAFSAGRGGDDLIELVTSAAGEVIPDDDREVQAALAGLARAVARATRRDSRALTAEGVQAMRRAQQLAEPDAD